MAVERLTYTVTEVAEILGLSRSKTYELVATGEIPVLPIPGRRKLVARSTVRGLLGEAVRDGDGAARSTWRRTHQIGAPAPAHARATEPGRAAASAGGDYPEPRYPRLPRKIPGHGEARATTTSSWTSG